MSARKNDFQDDYDLVKAYLAVGWFFDRKDNLRVTRLKGTKSFDYLAQMANNEDAAYRVWVQEFGTPKQKKALSDNDAAKEYLAKVDSGEITLPKPPIDGRTVEGRKLKRRLQSSQAHQGWQGP